MSEDSGNVGGTVNLCSPSPSTFRPPCPYSPSSSPSSHSIVSPLHDNRLPVCSPPHSSSPPCTSSPAVPSIRSRSSTPDSTSQSHHRGRGKDRGHRRGRGRGTDRSPSPAASTSPIHGGGCPPRGGSRRRRNTERDRGTGRGRARCTVPVDFPNCQYSFTNPPSFLGHPLGPTFSLRKPESATSYTYFSLLLFDDALLNHICYQTNLYARLHPFRQATYQWFDTNVDELRSFWG